MELEEAVLILILGFVAIMIFWISGLSYLVIKKPQHVGVDGGLKAKIAPNNEKSLYEGGGESDEAIEEEPVELKEAPWEAEKETFEDEEPHKDIVEKKAKEDTAEQKEASLRPDDEAYQDEVEENAKEDPKEHEKALGGPDEEVKPKEPAKVCPKCEGEPSYLKQYDRYYCYNCSEYVEPVGKKEEEVLGEEANEEETEEQKEQLEVLKKLEEEAQEQREEEMAKKTLAEKLEVPWKLEEELLKDEETLGEPDKELKEDTRAQDEPIDEPEEHEEQRKEGQKMPIESAEESEKIGEEVYECPVCGYEVGADTTVCPRCESWLDSDEE